MILIIPPIIDKAITEHKIKSISDLYRTNYQTSDDYIFEIEIMEDDSSYVIHQFIDRYDDASHKRSKQRKKIDTLQVSKLPTRRKRKPKPADMPRRPLSAYNIFFQEQRALIIGKPVSIESVSGITRPPLSPGGSGEGQSPTSFVRKKRAHRRTHGKISFSDLAKQIGAAWNNLSSSEKKKYCDGASKEKARYQDELRLYKLKKKKEKDEDDSVDVSEDLDNDSTNYHNKGKRRKQYQRYQRECFQSHTNKSQAVEIDDSPSGLTIEIMRPKKPSSNLRNKRYRPMHILPTKRAREYDTMYPLPLNFDPSRCHPSEIVNEEEMMKVVSPFLNQPVSNDRHTCHESIPHAEEKVSMLSIQTSSSNVSSYSGNASAGTREVDNEMAEFINFFLKDSDRDVDNDQPVSNNDRTQKTTPSELYAFV